MRGRAGMTLIELITVLALIGILLGVSTLAIGAAMDRAENAADRLGELVADARIASARRSEPVQLRLMAGGEYDLVALDSAVVLEEGEAGLPEIAPASFQVTFFPAGTSTGGTLCLRTGASWQHLRIDRVTGALSRSDSAGCCVR